MADQIDQKRFAQLIGDAFVFKQQHDIEQVPWMLPVEGGAEFAGVEVRQRHHRDFGEAEFVLHGRHHFTVRDGENRASHHRGQFHFDGGVVPFHGEMQRVDFVPVAACHGGGQPLFEVVGDTVQGLVNGRQRLLPVTVRQVDQVDVHGQAWQVAHEQIDGGAALEGEAGFPEHKGQHLQQQRHLPVVGIIPVHGRLPGR